MVVAEAAAAVAPRCVVSAPCAHARTRSLYARAACAPPARTRAPPCLLSPSRLPARSTAHATHVQLQRAARSGTLRARNPNNVNVNVWCSVRNVSVVDDVPRLRTRSSSFCCHQRKCRKIVSDIK